VAVEHRGHPVAVQWLFQPARTQKRKDLRWLPFDGRLDWSVMKQGNALSGFELDEGRFEFQRLIHSLVDKALNALLSPRLERTRAEASREPFHAGKPDTKHFECLAI